MSMCVGVCAVERDMRVIPFHVLQQSVYNVSLTKEKRLSPPFRVKTSMLLEDVMLHFANGSDVFGEFLDGVVIAENEHFQLFFAGRHRRQLQRHGQEVCELKFSEQADGDDVL